MSKVGQSLLHFNDRIYKVVVWLLRIAVGATFLFAGFAKTVDPWGFVFKIEEYFQVWGVDWLWRETVICLAVTISTAEFITGFMLITGSLRRAACWFALLFMIVMLPLTAYIAIESPVDDCGCFGDAYIISNTATFIKNILLTVATIYLLFNNYKVAPLYKPLVQWLPIVVSLFYCLVLAFIGITIQPLVDFRSYKVGTPLFDSADSEIRLLYEKDGKIEAFDINDLPDSTWTYYGRSGSTSTHKSAIAIYDDGDDVTDYVVEKEGAQILLVVPDISKHTKARASMANNINDYVTSHGGSMNGLIGADYDGVIKWEQAAKPNFPVYSADDTSLKELVRGDAGLVYLYNDTIKWKRNLFSLSGDFPDFNMPDQLAVLRVYDSGVPILFISGCYLAILLVLSSSSLIRIKINKKKDEKKS